MTFFVQLLLMLAAAALEVGGDGLIRKGLVGPRWLIVLGFIVLGSYGVVVNRVGLDFSRMLGAYVGWFAVVSVLVGKWLFAERIAMSTWFGLAVILLGSLIIQMGRTAPPT